MFFTTSSPDHKCVTKTVPLLKSPVLLQVSLYHFLLVKTNKMKHVPSPHSFLLLLFGLVCVRSPLSVHYCHFFLFQSSFTSFFTPSHCSLGLPEDQARAWGQPFPVFVNHICSFLAYNYKWCWITTAHPSNCTTNLFVVSRVLLDGVCIRIEIAQCKGNDYKHVSVIKVNYCEYCLRSYGKCYL